MRASRLPRASGFATALLFASLFAVGAPRCLAESATQPSAAKASAASIVSPPIAPGERGSKVYALDHDHKQGAVVDGDTIRLKGVKETVRLISVDTEEVIRFDADEDAAKSDFAAYAAAQQEGHALPIKYGTPAGMAASAFAREYFAGVKDVLLVPDDPAQLTDFYDRMLGYLLVDRDGDGAYEDNFNIALVAAGHTPYFIKYGRARIWDEALTAAEKQARASGIGIWDPKPSADRAHYPDYEERLAWWAHRNACLEYFLAKHKDDETYVRLGLDATPEMLAKRDGKVTTIFGSIYISEDGDSEGAISMSHRRGLDLQFVIAAEDAARLRLQDYEGRLIYVTGTVQKDNSKLGVQLRIDDTSKVWMEPPLEDRQ